MNTEAENKTNKYLKGIVANLPEKPGIYQYLNAELYTLERLKT